MKQEPPVEEKSAHMRRLEARLEEMVRDLIHHGMRDVLTLEVHSNILSEVLDMKTDDMLTVVPVVSIVGLLVLKDVVQREELKQ